MSSNPLILAVDADREALARITSELRRRYDRDTDSSVRSSAPVDAPGCIGSSLPRKARIQPPSVAE
jgi:hypothetical protein